MSESKSKECNFCGGKNLRKGTEKEEGKEAVSIIVCMGCFGRWLD